MALRKKPVSPDVIQLRMADLCARSEQCEYDIDQKLYKAGLNPSDRERIINFLKEERFIDNRRFAGSFARDKCRFSAWGPYKIRMALLTKRISSAQIAEALESVEEKEWDEALMRCALSKSKNLDLNGIEARENKMKLYKYLLSRGFPSAKAAIAVKETVRKSSALG